MTTSDFVAQLRELAEIYNVLGDTYRERAYLTAARNISNLGRAFGPDDVNGKTKMAGVGVGIRVKLGEFIRTGLIRDLIKLRKDRRVVAHRTFAGIIGAGPVTIRGWVAKRLYTMSDLRKAYATKKISLTHAQQLGLKYYTDLNIRIPRIEVTAIAKAVIQIINMTDRNSTTVVAGSYRRMLSDSGDIDIITTAKPITRLIDILESDPHFVDIIMAGQERISFLWRQERVRQVDILSLPPGEFHAGVLYFTGDWGFNENMRGWAKSRGYRLNQHGLYRIQGTNLTLVPVKSELDIFDILGLKYVEPNLRSATAIKAI